jgi:hypothetical protein
VTNEPKRTQRGFRIYDERQDSYGSRVAIVESSGIEPGIWIQPQVTEMDGGHLANLLFTPDQAIKFAIAILNAALEKESYELDSP